MVAVLISGDYKRLKPKVNKRQRWSSGKNPVIYFALITLLITINILNRYYVTYIKEDDFESKG